MQIQGFAGINNLSPDLPSWIWRFACDLVILDARCSMWKRILLVRYSNILYTESNQSIVSLNQSIIEELWFSNVEVGGTR